MVFGSARRMRGKLFAPDRKGLFILAEHRGFTFIELIVVIGIMTMALAIGVVHFRNSRISSSMLASNIAFHMSMRQACEKIHEILQDGNEIVKPFEGHTLPYLIIRDVVNRTRILYLENSDSETEKPSILVTYLDEYTGSYNPDNKKKLFSGVKSVEFTTLSLGIIVINLTLTDPQGKELNSLFQVSLKNFGAIDGD